MDKQELWELIERHAPNLSDDIGWGSMDSLCDEILEGFNGKSQAKYKIPGLEESVAKLNSLTIRTPTKHERN